VAQTAIRRGRRGKGEKIDEGEATPLKNAPLKIDAPTVEPRVATVTGGPQLVPSPTLANLDDTTTAERVPEKEITGDGLYEMDSQAASDTLDSHDPSVIAAND
jgi:hypothetical protein